MNAIETAAALGVSEKTIRRAIGDGRLAATKKSGAFEIDLEAARAAVGVLRRPHVYRDALAEALQLLRAFNHESDAVDLERRHGLVYVEPRPQVRAA